MRLEWLWRIEWTGTFEGSPGRKWLFLQLLTIDDEGTTLCLTVFQEWTWSVISLTRGLKFGCKRDRNGPAASRTATRWLSWSNHIDTVVCKKQLYLNSAIDRSHRTKAIWLNYRLYLDVLALVLV